MFTGVAKVGAGAVEQIPHACLPERLELPHPTKSVPSFSPDLQNITCLHCDAIIHAALALVEDAGAPAEKIVSMLEDCLAKLDLPLTMNPPINQAAYATELQ